MTDAYVIVVYILSFGMSFAVGANDAANGLATSYGSGAASVWVLLIGGAIFEFIGAFFCSGEVAAKLVTRMIPDIYDEEPMPQTQYQLMFSASAASFLFILMVSLFGMPISGTHTIVGSLIGAGIAGLGASAISYSYLKKVVLSWFISPVVSGGLCFLFIVAVALTTLNGAGTSLKWRLFNAQLVTGMTFAIVCYLMLILVQKNYTAEGDNIVDPWQYWFLPAGFILGFLLSRLFMAHASKPEASTLEKLGFMCKLATFTIVEDSIDLDD